MTSGEAQTNQPPKSGFHYPFVWFVFGLPFSAVLIGVVMIVGANYHPDDLVVDDYYKQGMAINQQRKLNQVASSLALVAHVSATTDEGLRVGVESSSEQLTLSIFHVTDQRQDIVVQLVRVADNEYFSATDLAKEIAGLLTVEGIWYVELRDQAQGWRLTQRVRSPVERLVLTST